jgi:hypothetical protein
LFDNFTFRFLQDEQARRLLPEEVSRENRVRLIFDGEMRCAV